MKIINSIQSKIVLALVFLASLIIISVLFSNKIHDSNLSIINNKSNLYHLAASIDGLERNNKNYIENAPRDYESYNRDVKVFHTSLLKDIDTIDNSVKSLSDSYSLTNPMIILSDEFNIINSDILNTQEQWLKFKYGLFEQLGENKKEPRLEWGATFITEQAPKINNVFSNLIAKYSALSTKYTEASNKLSNGLIIVLAITLLLFAFWLFNAVIRPIKEASIAFKNVASGNYGLQIPEQRKDEIGTLVQSFNSLSSRTKLVLSIISELQNSNHPMKAIASLHKISQNYLGANFMGVLQVDTTNSKARYSYLSPKEEYKALSGKVVRLHPGSERDTFLTRLHNQESILIGDISSFIQSHADSELIKILSRHSILQSAILIPLNTDKWHGLLIIASNQLDHFENEQLKLMSNMSPLIAKGFAASLVRAHAFNKLKTVSL